MSGAVLIVGGAGVIGRIVAADLRADHEVLVADPAADDPAERWQVDRSLLDEVLPGCDAVIHLPTGAPRGPEGLLEVDVGLTAAVLDAARDHGIRRVVVASSNHAVGAYETDARRAGLARPPSMVPIHAEIRPDSLYGAAKAFGEAYGRCIAETSATAVSCLRIGTVREYDDPERCARESGFDDIPGGFEGRVERLRATWLTHPDLCRIVREELAAGEAWRLRFAVSDNPGRFWSTTVMTWDRTS